MSLSHEPKPLQWALPEALEVPPDQLKVRLDFYGDSVLMYVVDNGRITTRMVSARDIAMAMLREIPLTSGLLPPSALWWSQSRDGPEVALWRPPRVWPVALVAEPLKPPHRLRLPMPGLIFVCRPASAPRVYAATKRPRSLESAIYHAPLFNLFTDGRSCPGTHKYPENIDEIPESFFASFFSPTGVDSNRSRKYPGNLMNLWRELDGKKRYPVRDLVQFGTVRDIMRLS